MKGTFFLNIITKQFVVYFKRKYYWYVCLCTYTLKYSDRIKYTYSLLSFSFNNYSLKYLNVSKYRSTLFYARTV